MSTEQCQRLREAFLHIRRRPTKVIVLMGGTDFWSNGIHLNTIEATADPAHESWRNIQAMNDLVLDLITTDSHLVISALQGNAAACHAGSQHPTQRSHRPPARSCLAARRQGQGLRGCRGKVPAGGVGVSPNLS